MDACGNFREPPLSRSADHDLFRLDCLGNQSHIHLKAFVRWDDKGLNLFPVAHGAHRELICSWIEIGDEKEAFRVCRCASIEANEHDVGIRYSFACEAVGDDPVDRGSLSVYGKKHEGGTRKGYPDGANETHCFPGYLIRRSFRVKITPSADNLQMYIPVGKFEASHRT